MDSKITERTYRITTNKDGVEHQYYFWGVSRASINKNASITEYPTQEGTGFADHKYRELETVTIDLNVTELVDTHHPYSIIGNVHSKLTVNELKDLIKYWFESDTFLNIRTTQEEFLNYQLQSYSFTEDKESFYAWRPSLTFREVRVTNVESLAYQFPGTAEDGASNTPSATRGPNNGNNVEYEDEITASSVVGGTAAGAAIGAGVGAIVGSIIPGAGTAAGAVLGAKIGSFVGLAGEAFGWW